MTSEGSGDEQTSPPRRSGGQRAKTRHIIRWSDEKLILAFAEFRTAAQRHRVDIKKPLEDAAKAIGPFCTSDALIQQLTKRRNRLLSDAQNQGSTLASSPVASGLSTPKQRKPSTRAKTVKTDVSSFPALANPVPAATPLSAPPPTPRSSTRAKIKKELGVESDLEEDSDSTYTESPLKAKKKRVPRNKRKSASVAAKKNKLLFDSGDEFAEDEGSERETALKQMLTPPPNDLARPSLPGKKDARFEHKSSSSSLKALGNIEDVYYAKDNDDKAKNSSGGNGKDQNGVQKYQKSSPPETNAIAPQVLQGEAAEAGETGLSGPLHNLQLMGYNLNPESHGVQMSQNGNDQLFDLNHPLTQDQLAQLQLWRVQMAQSIMQSGHVLPPSLNRGQAAAPMDFFGLMSLTQFGSSINGNSDMRGGNTMNGFGLGAGRSPRSGIIVSNSPNVVQSNARPSHSPQIPHSDSFDMGKNTDSNHNSQDSKLFISPEHHLHDEPMRGSDPILGRDNRHRLRHGSPFGFGDLMESPTFDFEDGDHDTPKRRCLAAPMNDGFNME